MPDTSTSRPSLLAVSSELPWPLNTGGHLRTFHVLKALAARFAVRLVVPTADSNPEAVKALGARSIQVVEVPIAPRTTLTEAGRLMEARLRGEPYALYRRHAYRAMLRTWERELAERPALVHLDHLDSFLYFESARRAGIPGVLDLHNVYSLVIRRLAEESANPLRRAFLRGEARRLDAVEARACRSGAVILAVSNEEAAHYRQSGATDVTVAPNGVDCSAFSSLPTGRANTPPVILYLGTLSWGPNVSAATYLAGQVFPAVRASYPGARLMLVGRDPSPGILKLADEPGVTVAGSVPSIQPYLAEASMLAVPLDSGGGTRLKILEAFAAGLPVVSTAVGAEGIDARNDQEIVIAERPNMAAAIVQLAREQGRADQIAANARRLARDVYDWSRIGDVIVRRELAAIGAYWPATSNT